MIGSGSRRRRVIRSLALAIAGSAMAVAAASAQDVGLPLGTVPAAVQVEDLDGNAVDLGRYIGQKPVLIEFWATWCPLCEELEPQLHAVKRQHGDAIDVVIVAVGVNQNVRGIRRHMTDHTMPGPVLFDGRGRATREFRAPSTSYIVALDRAGRVVYTGIGADQDLAAAALRALGR